MNKKKVYQNEPVIVTYKLYTRVDVSSYGFSKLPGTTGFWTESFDTPQRPELATEVLEGKQYRVATLKKMALFPMSAGTKTIDPMGVECEVRVSRKRSRSMFDDFFNDSFFFGRTERKEILSKPVNIQVMPLPSEGKPENYTGVVGQFALTGRVDKTETKTNEAITYKVKISGQGNIRTLPEPVIYFPPDFEVYPPKKTEKIERTGNTISGHKTYEYILVPRIAGLQKIKPIQLSVFDTKARAYKTLSTKEILIDVAKGSDVFSTVPSGLSREEVRFIGFLCTCTLLDDIDFTSALYRNGICLSSSSESSLWGCGLCPEPACITGCKKTAGRGQIATGCFFADRLLCRGTKRIDVLSGR